MPPEVAARPRGEPRHRYRAAMMSTRTRTILTVAATAIAAAGTVALTTPDAAQAAPTSGTVYNATISDCNRAVVNIRASNYYTSTRCFQIKNAPGWYYTWYAPRAR